MAATEPKAPGKAADLLVDDLPSTEPPATGSWECPPNYHPDRYAPFLKHIADLTGTKVTYDELGDKVDVLGKDAAVVEQTINRLTHLHSALSLLTPVPASHQHHMFLPAVGYDKLQIVPFRHHSAAATVKILASADEWSSLASMGVLVPFRQGVRLKDMNVATATPRPAVASRFFSSQSFKKFGNYDMYNTKAAAAAASGSSSSSNAAERVVPTPERAEPVLTLRPKEYYSILASENADRVTKWVDKATEPGTPLADPQQSVPPEEYPPEQKPVRGVLKRRVRQTSKSSPVKSQPKVDEEKALDELKPAPSFIPLKPKPAPSLHRTMAQKTSPGSKSPLKQATLEKFWSNAFAAVEKEKSNSKSASRGSSPNVIPRPTTNDEEKKLEPSVQEASVSTQNDVKEVQNTTPQPAQHADSRDVLQIFNALQPTLDAARSFPGTLELEAHIELITIAPSLPGSGFDETVMTQDEWKEKFQSKQGNPLAPYWAWNKVTGSGEDVDAMIDMIWSKRNPQRIFHETPANCNAVFEYHCRLRDGSTFVISLDEVGHPSFHQTPYVLGCSTIHFPHRMWDMTITLKGEMNLHSDKDPAVKKAIDTFVKTIYFEPGNDLTIFCSAPKNKIFLVEKILMKSTILHQHRPVKEETSSELMLKTVEVRQFLTAHKPGHPTLIRGRIPVNNRQECVAAKMLWYEVSVVSSAVQKLLTSNRELELGQQTQKWTAVGLLGDEIEVKDVPYDSNEVAQSVGDSGLGSMYRLAKVILDRMRIGDAVV